MVQVFYDVMKHSLLKNVVWQKPMYTSCWTILSRLSVNDLRHRLQQDTLGTMGSTNQEVPKHPDNRQEVLMPLTIIHLCLT